MQKILRVRSDEEAIKLFGQLDEHVTFTERTFKVSIHARGFRITISGDDDRVTKAEVFLRTLLQAIRRGENIHAHQLEQLVAEPHAQTTASKTNADKTVARDGAVFTTFKGTAIREKTAGQHEYLTQAREHDIIFCIGPAGTGKTYLAVATALAMLKRRVVSRLILTRPAVEAGESLGFLPGDMYAKINPYLRPLYDALYEMLGFDEVARCIDKGIIEIAPLAYMRGRTLNDAFIILDEAQNVTPPQMKMFLTRLGYSSRCIVTGDITQIDLPPGVHSGLIDAQRVLQDIAGIVFVYLHERDVVRHQLVKDIIQAYEKKEDKRT